ncbi:hypothetical protein Patl1_09351 [Pistacia atlantica]|uniref:Uncharacterized protein n=1 Tax=Pistacia atlantica TaxID=434234 RepID=A0ACC1AIR6_9ROSI|nr:hypothetical protein Patl1_09351 [Pistacia atlantica]
MHWVKGKDRIGLNLKGTGRVRRSQIERMAIMRGKPLVAKLAAVAMYVVLPGAMLAAVVYSPPPYESSSKSDKPRNLHRLL